MKRTMLLASFASLILISNGFATTWHVAPDGSGDAPTVQAAIDLCVPGDVVQLEHGVYTAVDGIGDDPVSHGGGRPVCAALKSGVTIRGDLEHPELVVLDAGEAGGVIFCASVTGVVLEGITIANGSTDVVWNGSGGGIYCTYSDLTITNCRIVGNSSPDHGGGLQGQMATITIEGCLFDDNFSAFTGGGAYFTSSTVNVDGTVVSNNTIMHGGGSPTYSGGAGFYFDDSDLQISQCSFLANTVDSGGGGGINCYTGNTGTIESTLFEGNQASWGGALRIWNNSIVDVLDCSIHSNDAWQHGGALSALWSTDISVLNTDFGSNTAPTGAEGFIEEGCAVLLNCCIVDPSGWDGAGSWSIDNEGCAIPNAQMPWGAVKQLFK